jgi:predicted RNase H-like nuclease
MRVAGADVWKGKWIVVVLDDGRFVRAFVAPDIVAAVGELDDCVAIGVDMPIGLPPAGVPRISAQAFALKKQILAVQPLARADQRIWEVHPEVSFTEANGGVPLEWAKSSWNGAVLRPRILESHGITIPGDLGPAGAVDVPDALDASIAAWSADRIAWGSAQSFPAGAERIGAIWR